MYCKYTDTVTIVHIISSILPTVPAPTVFIMANTSTAMSAYAGSALRLTCNAAYTSFIDTLATVSITWEPSIVYEDDRVTISETSQFLNTAVYQSFLTIGSVVLIDEMNYTCVGSVMPESPDSSLTGSVGGEGTLTLLVEGIMCSDDLNSLYHTALKFCGSKFSQMLHFVE